MTVGLGLSKDGNDFLWEEEAKILVKTKQNEEAISLMKKVGSKVWKWTKRLVVAFFVLSIISTILFRFIPVPVTPLMLIRCVEQVADGKAP